MTLRAARAADMDRIRGLWHAHLATSMFQLSNIAEHGLGSDAPRGLNLWVDEAVENAFAFTNEGMVMPQMPSPSATQWREAAALVDRPLIGALGDPDQVRAFLRAAGLANAPKRISDDSEAYRLSLSDLVLPPCQGFDLRRAAQSDREVMLRWRRDFMVEIFDSPFDEASEQAAEDFDRFRTKGSHMILNHDGVDVAMTGFNAVVGDVVQIGGVYTPPDLRCRGYARRAVALHLAQARNEGATTALLFAANAQAAKAYRAIGFQRNGSFALVLFDGPQEVTT